MLPVEEMVVNDESISVSARSWGQGCGRNGLGLGAKWGKRSHTVGALQAAWKRRVILILILTLILSVHSGAVNY
jgi:hypothetical protein